MQPFFLTEDERIPVPLSWSRHIQRGRVYDADQGDGRLLWEAVMNQAANQEKPALAFRESSHRVPITNLWHLVDRHEWYWLVALLD